MNEKALRLWDAVDFAKLSGDNRPKLLNVAMLAALNVVHDAAKVGRSSCRVVDVWEHLLVDLRRELEKRGFQTNQYGKDAVDIHWS